MKPLFSVACKEKRGEVTRDIFALSDSGMDINTLKMFWEKARPFKTLFNKEIQDNFEKFLSMFVRQDTNGTPVINGLFWQVDEAMTGMYYMTDIIVGYDATVHFVFFDRILNGRKEMTMMMLRYLFEKYQFRRLSVEIPKYVIDGPKTFVKCIGFKPEGRKRKAAFYNGEWYDTSIYGILPEEIGKDYNKINHISDQPKDRNESLTLVG